MENDTQENSAEAVERLELPPQNDLLRPVSGREGWTFEIPGTLVKQSHPMWTDAQKHGKITIEGVALTSSEEKRIAVAASSEPGSATLRGVMATLYAIDGKKIDHMDRENVWEALGSRGRPLYARFYQKFYSVEDEELAAIGKTFRVSAG